MDNKLTLKNVDVIFANLTDEGYGTSLTLDVTDNEKAVSDWVKKNNIGKKTPGIPLFKEYEGKKQYAFKLTDYTRIAGLDGLGKEDLGFGAKVSIVANPYEYNNKFGNAISSSLSAVLVESRGNTSSDDDLATLMGDTKSEPVANEPTEDKINLDSIPF